MLLPVLPWRSAARYCMFRLMLAPVSLAANPDQDADLP